MTLIPSPGSQMEQHPHRQAFQTELSCHLTVGEAPQPGTKRWGIEKQSVTTCRMGQYCEICYHFILGRITNEEFEILQKILFRHGWDRRRFLSK
jgi:hypothetical protein